VVISERNSPEQVMILADAANGRMGKAVDWSYDEAFARNRGLVSAVEQERLRQCRVAIPGMGGVGGIHLATLARLGIGSFHIADPDRFEAANFNRQHGATLNSLGRNKAEVMTEQARAINPDVQLQTWTEPVTRANIDAFLEGVDVIVDGLDFFALEARRLVFAEARRRGLWVVTAGPIGFSTAWITFAPDGMSFDEYFDLRDGMDRLDQLIAFAIGVAPAGTHWPYMTNVNLRGGQGPSAGLACQLCAGVAAAEVIKVLLGRGRLRPAPWYGQFDAYRGVLRTSYLRWGNRHPVQRLKRWWFRRKLEGTQPPRGDE
jgi:molybdopterin/thiamine biosynthesis adenylyltransferase